MLYEFKTKHPLRTTKITRAVYDNDIDAIKRAQTIGKRLPMGAKVSVQLQETTAQYIVTSRGGVVIGTFLQRLQLSPD